MFNYTLIGALAAVGVYEVTTVSSPYTAAAWCIIMAAGLYGHHLAKKAPKK